MLDIESILVDNLKESKKKNKVVIRKKKNAWKSWPKDRSLSQYKSKVLSGWSQRDFSFYMGDEYIKSTGEVWNYNFLGITTYLSRVKAKLRDSYGFCDNVLLKAYIDYFYEEWLNYCKNSNIKFWLNFMLDKKPLSAFCSSYDYQDNIETENIVEVTDSHNSVSEQDLNSFYSLSFEALVFNYGLVLPINYILGKNLLSERKVYNKISQIIISSTQNGSITQIKEKTEKYNNIIGSIDKNMIVEKLKDDYSIIIDI